MKLKKVGSVCSGIEAASLAWSNLGFEFEWFSEISDFPSKVLEEKYPNIRNLGDMRNISSLLNEGLISSPDIICGGTPCQSFSYAGLQNGLTDERGNLTLNFVDIINTNDSIRLKNNLDPTIVFWENVEGVLSDKTNAFGCFISALSGVDKMNSYSRWPNAGIIRGEKRNIAWRILDAKYFGIPQQRRRLYLVAGGKNFSPESILFEKGFSEQPTYPEYSLTFEKDGNKFEVFRGYTDCLYSAYGTKWNGNAAAYNGSLYILQNERLRRLSPLECERLMGFPDDYTNIKNSKRTQRYQVIGNSWSIPVVQYIGKNIVKYSENKLPFLGIENPSEVKLITSFDLSINVSIYPNKSKFSNMESIICSDVPEEIYISPVGCFGILRRKIERNLKMNARLEEVLTEISSTWSLEEIESISKKQKRGKFSNLNKNPVQISLI